jgi:hypothetical protein
MFSTSKIGGAGGAAAPDTNFSAVTMLLHGDGTNGAQNNTFVDSSSNNFTITRNGNTTQGTFSPYGSNWSNYFNGTTDYLTIASNAVFSFGTSVDFTIELWVNTSSTANMALIDARPTLSAQPWALYLNTSSAPYFYNGSSFTSSVAITLGVWNHIAISRASGTLKIFVNGVQGYSAANTANLTSGDIRIGGTSAGSDFAGHISNVRIVNGTGLYTTAFTPPTAPLTAITNTALLTCQSNRFIDNSSNAFAITATGTPSIQRFSPFSPSTAYSTSVIGGSGYFDGTGDYLNTPATGQFAPAGNFTVSCWFYPTNLTTYNELVGNYTGNFGTDWIIEVKLDGTINLYTNGAAIRIASSAGLVKIGAWHHISMSRSGSTITGYLNGVSFGTYTQSGTFGSGTKTIYVGCQAGSSAYITGYLSDVKLIDGSVVTAVPTAPQTATTGTSLLLNFTNAGIYDNAMMNDLETVGNAQVSTSVVKYGTGSMYFDGTGDWLASPYVAGLHDLTGNFTIEFWVYFNSQTSVNDLVATANNNSFIGASKSGWVVAVNSANGIRFSYQSNNSWVFDTVLGQTISNTTWTHIAIVRSGSTITGYKNGTASGTTITSSAALVSNTYGVYVGAGAGDSGTISNCYIDDLRITKGVARYTANFTTPTAAFPNN